MSGENIRSISGFSVYSNVAARSLDILGVLVAAYIAFYLRFGFVTGMTERYQWMTLSGMLLVGMIFSASGVYRSWRGSVRVELVTLLSRSFLIVSAIIFSYLFFSKTGEEFSRLWLFHWLMMSFCISVGSRVIAYPILNKIRRNGRNRKHVMLVGSSSACALVISRLEKVPSAGLDVKYVRTLDDAFINEESKSYAMFDAERDTELFVDEIWVCLPLSRGGEVEHILNCFKHSVANVRYIPDLNEFLLLNHTVSTVAGMYLLNMSCSPMSGTARIIKELEDRIISLFALFIFSPLMLIIAVFIKLTSKGPVLFKQKRMSWSGQSFDIYKFRSMKVHAETNGAVWGKAKEKPLTAIGAFLRKSNLDELPQLFNVLLGDMSLVGPRPERIEFVERFKYEIPGYMQKHMVKAGMTGWAQVKGFRGDTNLGKRIELDLWYIENWSFWLDMKIFFLTIVRVWKNRGR